MKKQISEEKFLKKWCEAILSNFGKVPEKPNTNDFPVMNSIMFDQFPKVYLEEENNKKDKVGRKRRDWFVRIEEKNG